MLLKKVSLEYPFFGFSFFFSTFFFLYLMLKFLKRMNKTMRKKKNTRYQFGQEKSTVDNGEKKTKSQKEI